MADSAKLQLYSFWWSSASHRVRIALNLKGLEYEYKPVNLLKNEQSSPEFVKLNPLKYVPVLVDGDVVIVDSFVISLYLEDKYPEHPLLPKDLKNKALNLQNYIEGKLNSDEKVAWAQYHINNGFEALEKLLKDVAGKYATGDEVQLADTFLAPQILIAASKFEIDMSRYPTLARLKEAYDEHPAFQAALPANQPDAPPPS